MVRAEVEEIQLRRLIPAPFAWYKQTCTLEAEHIDLAIIKYKTRGLVYIVIPRCEPYRDRLCAMANSHENLVTASCAKLLVTGASINEFTQHCSIARQPSKANTKLVTIINANTFAHYACVTDF